MLKPASFAASLLIFTLAGCGGSAGQGDQGGAQTPAPTASPAPTVSLAANPVSVASGGSSMLTWSSTDATSCTASGSWSGTKAASGNQLTVALTNTTQFNLSCTGAGGTKSTSVIVSVVPAPGALPAWANALAIGQWFQIPNTAMSSVAPSPTPAGNTGPQSKVIAWTSFVADPRTSKVYSLANGGHSDYSGNEVDVLDLERAQPAWSQLLPPTPNAQLTNCQNYYADGRPAARHTYYGVTFNELDDRIMLLGGAIWCAAGGFFTPISSYNIGANTWSPSTTHGNITNAFASAPAYTSDPSTGDIYGLADFVLGRWNRSSNSFTTLNPAGSVPVGYQAMSAFDSSRGRILFLGGGGSAHHLYTPSNNTMTPVSLSGANAVNVTGAQQNAMFYVAAIDRFLVRGGSAGGTVYQVNPSTFEVTTFLATDGAAIPSTLNGPFNKFLYLPRMGGAVYVPSHSGNAWFLRIH